MYEVLCKGPHSFTAEHHGDFTFRAALDKAEALFVKGMGEVSLRSINSGKVYLY